MKSSTAFIVTFSLLGASFLAVQSIMPDACKLPSTYLSKDAMVLAIAQGCEIDVSKDPMVKAFGSLSKRSTISSDVIDTIDIRAWVRFSKAQVQLNDTLEYSRDSVINPSQILYKSMDEYRTVKALAVILASSYCSDGSESEAYEDMINTFNAKSPEIMSEATTLAFYAIQDLGCL